MLVRRFIILINCEFIIIPRIIFNDKDVSKTTAIVLGLIISLTLKNNYCYASNKYLANYLNVSKRTITESLSILKKLNYIKIIYVDGNRHIYLNSEKVPIKTAMSVEKNSMVNIAESCDHKINNKYNNKYINNKNISPSWLEHCDDIREEPYDLNDPKQLKEYQELEDMFREFK